MASAPAVGADLRGIHSVLCTPFLADEQVDHASLERLVDRQLDLAVDGLVLFALAGEGAKLSEAERLDTARRVVDRVAGRLPVIAAADHPSAIGAARLARGLAEAGTSAVMVLPPVGTRGGEAGLADYYRRISDAVAVSVIVQDAPAATGVTLSAEFLADLGRVTDHIRGVKVEAPPVRAKIREILRLSDDSMSVIGGLGGRDLIGELSVGSVGSMIGCATAAAFVAIFRAWNEGDADGAEALWESLLPLLVFDDSIDAFIECQKLLLVAEGVFADARLRQPAVSLDASDRREWFRRVARVARGRPRLIPLPDVAWEEHDD